LKKNLKPDFRKFDISILTRNASYYGLLSDGPKKNEAWLKQSDPVRLVGFSAQNGSDLN